MPISSWEKGKESLHNPLNQLRGREENPSPQPPPLQGEGEQEAVRLPSPQPRKGVCCLAPPVCCLAPLSFQGRGWGRGFFTPSDAKGLVERHRSCNDKLQPQEEETMSNAAMDLIQPWSQWPRLVGERLG